MRFLKNNSLMIALVLAFFVRVIGIVSRPIWYDEAFSILLAESGFEGMIHGTLAPGAAEPHPLGYYAVLLGAIRLLGDSIWVVRGVSVVMGVGGVLMGYLILKALSLEKAALTGAFLLALSPFQIHYSQEIRMYALLTLLLVGAVYAFVRGSESGDWRWWAAFGLLAAGAQYTHNLAVFFLAPLAFTAVFRRDWRAFRGVVVAGIGAIVLYLPWLVQLFGQFARIQQSYWTARPPVSRLLTTMLSFGTNLPLPDAWLPIGLFLTVLIIALAGLQTYRARLKKIQGANHGLWLLYMAFAPVILLFVVSQWQPVFVERALLPAGAMFVLWVAWAVSSAKMQPVGRLLVIGLYLAAAAMGIYQHVTYAGFPYAPYTALAESIEERISDGDKVVHSNKLTMLPMTYYAPEMPQIFVADPDGSGSDTLAGPAQESLGVQESVSVIDAVGDADRVWFIIFQKAITEYQDQGLETHPQLSELQTAYPEFATETWGELTLYIFER